MEHSFEHHFSLRPVRCFRHQTQAFLPSIKGVSRSDKLRRRDLCSRVSSRIFGFILGFHMPVYIRALQGALQRADAALIIDEQVDAFRADQGVGAVEVGLYVYWPYPILYPLIRQ